MDGYRQFVLHPTSRLSALGRPDAECHGWQDLLAPCVVMRIDGCARVYKEQHVGELRLYAFVDFDGFVGGNKH